MAKVSHRHPVPDSAMPKKRPVVRSRDRSTSFLLRMAPEHRATIRAAAEEQGQSVQEFILIAALKAASWPMAADCDSPITPDEAEVMQELLGIPEDSRATLRLPLTLPTGEVIT